MNASTPFVLEAQASPLLSRLTCSDEENVKDAVHQLRRCSTDADYVRWARQWGESLCASSGFDVSKVSDYADLEEDLKKAERRVDGLTGAINSALKSIDVLSDGNDLGPKVTDEIDTIYGALERALGE